MVIATDNLHRGSTLDAFMEEQGIVTEFEDIAIEEVLAWRLDQDDKTPANHSLERQSKV